TPAVHDEVGCTATVDAWDMPHPGLFQLLCRGGQAFRILERATQPDGLIVAQVELLEDATGAIEAEAAALCRQVLEQIIARGTGVVLPAPAVRGWPLGQLP